MNHFFETFRFKRAATIPKFYYIGNAQIRNDVRQKGLQVCGNAQ